MFYIANKDLFIPLLKSISVHKILISVNGSFGVFFVIFFMFGLYTRILYDLSSYLSTQPVKDFFSTAGIAFYLFSEKDLSFDIYKTTNGVSKLYAFIFIFMCYLDS